MNRWIDFDQCFFFSSLRESLLRQLSILESYYQDGLSQPTDSQVAEILERFGSTGESGLLLSKNIIVMWFNQRRDLPKVYEFIS
jgi:hypothetical protein